MNRIVSITSSSTSNAPVDARAEMLVNDPQSWVDFQEQLVSAGVVTNWGVMEMAEEFMKERFYGRDAGLLETSASQAASAGFTSSKPEATAQLNLNEIGRCPVRKSSTQFAGPERLITDPNRSHQRKSSFGKTASSLGSVFGMA